MLKLLKNIFSSGDVATSKPVTRAERAESYKKDVREAGYRYTVIALGAKLASIDGDINEAEVANFSGLFPGNEIASLLTDARNDRATTEHYAERIKAFYPGNKNLFKKVITNLFDLAASDGPINNDEMLFLKDLTAVFEVDEGFFIENVKRIILPASSNQYDILSTSRNVNEFDLKKAYRDAIQVYHPDRLSAFNLGNEVIAIANQRINVINDAYNSIKNQKKYK